MTEETSNTMDRRAFVRRAGTVGAAGAMVWAAPSITTLSRAFGQTNGTPDCGRIMALRVNMIERPRPSSAKRNDIQHDSEVYIWLEALTTSGSDGINVPNANPSTVVDGSDTHVGSLNIPPNTPIAVYMIHAQAADGSGPQTNWKTQTGGVTFTQKVLGVTSSYSGLLATDHLSPVEYDTDGTDALARRFEDVNEGATDFGTVLEEGVDVITTQGGWPDQMRVFVECVTPDETA